eukprot:m.87616 g.87616  ORF g.87616 m.87616 type:complete len:561 (-) comp13119_c0_seq2:75-1757(-)
MSHLSSSIRSDPEEPCFVASIDAGTSSTRFTVYDELGRIIATTQLKLDAIVPDDGWCEYDANGLLDATYQCMENVANQMKDAGLKPSSVRAIGVTNQREATVVWDKVTGQPFHNIIAGLDARTTDLVDQLVKKAGGNKLKFQKICGLPISTYFSAVKLRWLLDSDATIAEEARSGRCLFGTVDSWLLWNFTGGLQGGLHITDVTNASRTLLMNLSTLSWDPTLLNFFGINKDILPEIRSSSEIYGRMQKGPFTGVHLSGIVGDEQAALVGQHCFKRGDAKNTYGTGCFLLYNTGTKPVVSKNGLLTTVAYKFGPTGQCHYALEGSIAIAGEAVRWLRDNLGIIKSSEEIGTLAATVSSTHGVYFVPAFSGLLTPYWRHDARGVIVGLSQYSTKAHIARAALESVCFQTREVLEACNKDCGIPFGKLRVDGGMSVNDVMLGLQADILGLSVERPKNIETTSWGAAFVAGMADGINVWKLATDPVSGAADTVFGPTNNADDRDERYAYWRKAVSKSLGWIPDGSSDNDAPQLETRQSKTLQVLLYVSLASAIIVAMRLYRNK